MEKSNKSGLVRDLLIKIFLILLFVFLITLLFPMPNLTPFYNRIFNENIENMKDAAESYFTKERMPSNVGDSIKLTLQDLLDKKLILPFLDKDGKECDLEKSYVKVTKKETEYELEVHLKCGKEDNYIVEPLGCYNFCPDNSCVNDVTTDEQTGKVTLNKTNPTTPDSNDNGKYKLQYLYTRTLDSTDWVLGDYTTVKQKEDSNTKLVDTKTQYTGRKKLSTGSSMYKHVLYGYKDNWTYDTDWTDEVKQITDNVKLADTRTLYTGQRKYTEEVNSYKHIKYGYKDNWTTDTNWVDEKKTETDKVKLVDTRTLYTGQRKYTQEVNSYKHIKYGYKDNWTTDTNWVDEKKTETDKVKLADTRTLYTGQRKYTQEVNNYKYVKYEIKDNWSETGWQTNKYIEDSNTILLATRYTVRKDTTTSSWSNWIKDSTWRTSKPANTSTKQWSDAYNQRTTTSEKILYNSFESTSPLDSTDTRRYELLYTNDVPCKTQCSSSTVRVYYYRVYEISKKTEYQYMYRTYSSSNSVQKDEKIVSDPTPYVKDGYTIVKYEYNYKVNNPTKVVVDTKWSTSSTAPSGYVYANEKKITKVTKYENLNKWVTSKSALGEYTYNVTTKVQYKYKYNEPTKVIEDTKWTESQNSPSGYVYANEKKITKVTKYENLNKWVTSKSALGEYTYNVTTRVQYKYKYNDPIKFIEDTKWTESQNSPSGYVYANEKKITRITKYENLNKWVTSFGNLEEYTYNVTTRVQYKYKYNNPSRYIKDTIWTESQTPPSGYTYTGESKTSNSTGYADLGYWVDSKKELGEYTYDITTRKLYRYKYKNTTNYTESQWFDSNPGGDWVFANKTRKVKVD